MIFGWVIAPVLLFVYLRFGYVPVAVNGPVIPFEELLAGTAVQARIQKEAPKQAGLPASPENISAGAIIYHQRCIECHGTPGSTPSAAAKGMFPPPPQFFEHKGMGNDPVGQNYWIVSNGVRLTGMPGYRETLSDTELWQVSQMLSNRGTLSPDTLELLTAK
jgi:mono/diheme cytochrome c family protein